MTAAAAWRSFVLTGDDHFSPLATEQEAVIDRRYRRGPDVDAALLSAVIETAAADVLQVISGPDDGGLAARIGDHVPGRVLVVGPGATLLAGMQARGVCGVAGDVRALPVRSSAVDCVVVDRALRRRRAVAEGLPEIARVLDAEGVLLVVARSAVRDGHELDELLGREHRARPEALSAENGRDLLLDVFEHVDEQPLDYSLEFPGGAALARYLRTVRRQEADAERVAGISHQVRLTFGMTLFTAAVPRRR